MAERLKVLIAEDDPEAARLLTDQLRELPGLDILLAGDGREALDMVRLLRPDVLLLDLILPDVTGFGVLQALRRVRPERRPRVIVLTAVYSESVKTRVLELGAEFLFVKPVRIEELSALLWGTAPATAEDLLLRVVGEEERGDSFYRTAAVLERLARTPGASLKEAYDDVMTRECISYDGVDKSVYRLIDRAERRGGSAYRAVFAQRPTVSVFLRRMAGQIKVS